MTDNKKDNNKIDNNDINTIEKNNEVDKIKKNSSVDKIEIIEDDNQLKKDTDLKKDTKSKKNKNLDNHLAKQIENDKVTISSSELSSAFENLQELVDEVSQNFELVPTSEFLPENIILLPLFQKPIFPGQIFPLIVAHPVIIKILKAAYKSKQKVIGLIMSKSNKPEKRHLKGQFKLEDIHSIGTVARILKLENLDTLAPENKHLKESQFFNPEHKSGLKGIRCVLNAVKRFEINDFLKSKPQPLASVKYIDEPVINKDDDELKAYSGAIMTTIRDIVRHNPVYSQEMNLFLAHSDINEPGKLADVATALTNSTREELQEIIESIDLKTRCEKALLLLKKELEFSELKEKINKQIEDKITHHQREFFLKEQLKAIKEELGFEKDEKSQDLEKFRKRIEGIELPEEAGKVIKEEFEKLSLLDTHSPDYGVSRNYLDWLTCLPWSNYSKDNFDLDNIEKILDQDHYGLEDVKKRIIEFMGVSSLKNEVLGSIILFVGPPGVGKTSLGKSVARALGRKFFRFSLGGMHDEAEIKGHRRTYIGAMPGKFIQAMKSVGTSNPVVMLDEIDKVGTSYRGDPASALLEVLDPEQNNSFRDHYLDVPFDLSKVLFIATANVMDTIPAPLLDRMEVMRLSGYIMEEKVKIARKFIIPKQLEKHGLKTVDFKVTNSAIKDICTFYARESGVRNLEKNLKSLMRKGATQKARNKDDFEQLKISHKELEEHLGKKRPSADEEFGALEPGLVTGLAWTSLGGARLYIESIAVKSEKPDFKQTGQLGDVMLESSKIAFSYIMSIASKMNIDKNFFKKHTIHLHVPAGATPKDGPSAGITMATSLMSLALNKRLRPKLAMTGELTLSGRVLPVGGIKEKIIAAKRGKIKELIIPFDNRPDYHELPDHIKKDLKVWFVQKWPEVAQIAFDWKDMPNIIKKIKTPAFLTETSGVEV